MRCGCVHALGLARKEGGGSLCRPSRPSRPSRPCNQHCNRGVTHSDRSTLDRIVGVTLVCASFSKPTLPAAVSSVAAQWTVVQIVSTLEGCSDCKHSSTKYRVCSAATNGQQRITQHRAWLSLTPVRGKIPLSPASIAPVAEPRRVLERHRRQVGRTEGKGDVEGAEEGKVIGMGTHPRTKILVSSIQLLPVGGPVGVAGSSRISRSMP